MTDERADNLVTGRSLGRYRIVKTLGAGGMGEVYLALDPVLGRQVAVKVLPPEFTGDEDRLRRFAQEARAASSLNHPNIITIHEIGEADGMHFIVAEHVAGQSLREKLRSGRFEIAEALDIAYQVASALAMAHGAGIIHRDIKPENIMLRLDGFIKVLDFGLAKLTPAYRNAEAQTLRHGHTGQLEIKTRPGVIVGTPHYMSPEQARGIPQDERTDIFSLGVVLYEMAAGASPFSSDTLADVIAAILYQQPAGVAQLFDDLPAELDIILSRALAKDTQQRYQSMSELAGDLRSLREELLFQARQKQVTEGARLDRVTSEPTVLNKLTATRETRTNLPVWPTSLVGREPELNAIDSLLSKADLRLLTLTGPGGTGKTRLSLEAAARTLKLFRDGVYFVPLAAITEAEVVCAEIAQTLKLKESAAVQLNTLLADYLRDKQMLLLLDNFEQVLDAAIYVAALLAAAPKLKIMVTSRSLLRVRGEQEYPVPPLTLADPVHLPAVETLKSYSAIALFSERAMLAKPDFQLTDENARGVAEICATLDGLPLAIELAAARIKLLAPKDLLARLGDRLNVLVGGARDLPERQQTIRETVKWSYELLSEEEKQLFRWLSVFIGGFTMANAEKLCATLVGLQIDPLDGVASLLEKSLVTRRGSSQDELRFGMLEIIRDYGLELLAAGGEEEAVKKSHAAQFLQLAEHAEGELLGERQKVWLELLEREHDNLRAALYWAEATGDAETGLRLAGALWRFWLMRGHFSEGRERLTRALQAADKGDASEARAKVLSGLGTLTQNQGDYETARQRFQECLSISRGLGYEKGIATALVNLGWIAFQRCDYPAALSLSEEGLALLQATGNKQGTALALNNLAFIAHYQGDYERARELHSQSAQIKRESADTRGLAFSLTHLARMHVKLGDYPEARRSVEEARALIEGVGDKQGIAYALAVQAEVLADQGCVEEALPMLQTANDLWREIRDRFGLNIGLSITAKAVMASGDDKSAKAIRLEGLRLQHELKNPRDVAIWLEILSEVAGKKSNWERAIRFLGAATALRETINSRLSAREAETHQMSVTKMRLNSVKDCLIPPGPAGRQ